MPDISPRAFIDFYRRMIVRDFGFEDAASATEEDVITKFISPVSNAGFVLPRFMRDLVFGEEVLGKMHRRTLDVDKKGHVLGDSVTVYDEMVRYFNPEVIYGSFNRHETPNLEVLIRDSLSSTDSSALVDRTMKWRSVMQGFENRYEGFWGYNLPNRLESIAAKTSPSEK